MPAPLSEEINKKKLLNWDVGQSWSSYSNSSWFEKGNSNLPLIINAQIIQNNSPNGGKVYFVESYKIQINLPLTKHALIDHALWNQECVLKCVTF